MIEVAGMSALLEPGRVSSSKGEGARRATPDKPGSTVVVEPRTAAALVAASMGRVLG